MLGCLCGVIIGERIDMPGYRTHLVGGLVAFGLTGILLAPVLKSLSSSYIALYVMMSLVGSLFPDIDIASKMQRMFFIGVTGLGVLTLLTNKPIHFFVIGFLVLMVTLLRHRTLTHNFFFLASMPFAVAYSLFYLYKIPTDLMINSAIFFAMGAFSHVLLDRSQTKLKRFFKKRHF